MKNFFRYFYLFVFFLFGFLFFVNPVSAAVPASPIIEVFDQGGDKYTLPLLTGLTEAGTKISVFLDDQYIDDAVVKSEKTETDNFYYQFKKSVVVGDHVLSVVAQKGNSVSEKRMYKFSVQLLPAPTLISPNKDSITGASKPFITGLTKSATFVHIFIDGVYNGRTEIKNHKSGTADFFYKPFLDLSVGNHTAYAIAEDSSGRKSNKSRELSFYIYEKTPTPSLISILFKPDNTDRQPLIIGLSKEGLKVRVYIDGKLNGEFMSANGSNVVNFAYKPFVPLRAGSHFVYITAVDEKGKESAWSSVKHFNIVDLIKIKDNKKDVVVATTTVPLIVVEKKSEENIIVKSDEYSEDVSTSTDGDVSTSTSLDKKNDSAIVGQIINDKASTGADKIDAEKSNKNLTVFILFLCAVTAWIFWVNRELIKERGESPDEKEKD